MTRRVCDLNPGPNTERFGIHGTDLLFPVLTPDGKRLLWFGGDSFRERFLKGWWSSPVMFVSAIGRPYDFINAFGDVDPNNKQILRYDHRKNGVSTKLPTSAIFVGGVLYLHYMIMGMGGLQDCVGTGIAASTDEGKTWQDLGKQWVGDAYGGVAQMCAFVDGHDGWIYSFKARGLARNSNVVLFRCRPQHIAAPAMYEAWGLNGANRTWGWGQNPWPILPNGVTVGELSAGWVDGKLVLSYFRSDPAYSGIEVRVGDQGFMTNWTTAPTYLPVRNGPDGPASLLQLYGGYIVPGSTLKNLKLAVSQWVTRTDDPYHVVIFDGIDVSRPPVVNPLDAARKALDDFLARFRR